MMRIVLITTLLLTMACSNKKGNEAPAGKQTPIDLITVLDTIWRTEQGPITLRDSLMKIYGAESKEVQIQQEIYEKNHIVNERKVKTILDKYGWPTKEMIGEQGNWTICNVIQHSDNEIRIKYLPMMRKAVKDKKIRAPIFS